MNESLKYCYRRTQRAGNARLVQSEDGSVDQAFPERETSQPFHAPVRGICRWVAATWKLLLLSARRLGLDPGNPRQRMVLISLQVPPHLQGESLAIDTGRTGFVIDAGRGCSSFDRRLRYGRPVRVFKETCGRGCFQRCEVCPDRIDRGSGIQLDLVSPAGLAIRGICRDAGRIIYLFPR